MQYTTPPNQAFTGLRIAASSAQGLAFSLQLPVVPVSTLACQAMTAARENALPAGLILLSTLDANIGQLYWGLYQVTEEGCAELMPPAVCTPEALPVAHIIAQVPTGAAVTCVGSGAALLADSALPVDRHYPEVLPQARDLLPLARIALAAGATQSAAEVAPVYVQDATRWKKLAEQGRAHD